MMVRSTEKVEEGQLSRSNTILCNRYRSSQGLLHVLHSDANNGIDADQHEMNRRELHYGLNCTKEPATKSIWDMMMEPFDDLIMKILVLSACVSLVCGGYENGLHGLIEGAAILFTIFLIVVVTTFNEYVKQQQFKELMKKGDKKIVTVKRMGKQVEIDSAKLVVGDIVLIKAGSTIPADCMLLQTISEVVCDESTFDGEPIERRKEPITELNQQHNPCPWIYQGSQCDKGSGWALVVCVGEHTNQYQTEKLLAMGNDDEKTPLQIKLDKVGHQIGLIGFATAGLCFVILTVRFAFRIRADDELDFFSVETLNTMVSFLIFSITVIVAAVPEGLPLAVTISLAFTVGKMYEEKNLVKQL